MTAKERKELLELARATIIAAVSGQPLPTPAKPGKGLLTEAGCFVTIKQQGQLRGCIGSFTAERPLWQTVQQMAISAATKDPRFYPMKPADLQNFTLEISVLSPLQQIESVEQIKVGVHGLYLIKGPYHGVLLPQVATEYGWDRETFLRQTCRKAGLPDDTWQKECEIYIFSAEIMEEQA